MKDKLEKSATEIEKHSEEIVKLKRLLEDKEKELIYKLQDKDNDISSYKAKEILEEKLRRKQELEIKSLKVELRKVCLTNFDFEKFLSQLIKENHVLKRQLQKSHEDDKNSKGKMEDNIFDLNKQVEEVKKIEEDLARQLQEKIEICQKKELKILSLKEDLKKQLLI